MKVFKPIFYIYLMMLIIISPFWLFTICHFFFFSITPIKIMQRFLLLFNLLATHLWFISTIPTCLIFIYFLFPYFFFFSTIVLYLLFFLFYLCTMVPYFDFFLLFHSHTQSNSVRHHKSLFYFIFLKRV